MLCVYTCYNVCVEGRNKFVQLVFPTIFTWVSGLCQGKVPLLAEPLLQPRSKPLNIPFTPVGAEPDSMEGLHVEKVVRNLRPRKRVQIISV